MGDTIDEKRSRTGHVNWEQPCLKRPMTTQPPLLGDTPKILSKPFKRQRERRRACPSTTASYRKKEVMRRIKTRTQRAVLTPAKLRVICLP
jgi:hypothetical protein